MRLGFKRGQKGFTLVELMVVMAILAVLAAIIIPPVTGTKQVSLDSQVKQDATNAQTAMSDFNADANLAENLVTDNRTTVLGESLTGYEMVTSNKWPELSIAVKYGTEFTAAIGTTANTVKAATIQDEDGTVLYSTNATSLKNFVALYNAFNVDILLSEGYLQQEPNGVDTTFSSSKAYHNYLWLVKKVAVGDDADSGRVVEVYGLITVVTTPATSLADTLTYQRIY